MAVFYKGNKINEIDYVDVRVVEPTLEIMTVDILENGTRTITPNEGYDGIESITINANVECQGGEGGNPFEVIGYEATPQCIQDGIDYAKTIQDEWDANIKSTDRKYYGDKQLVFFPLVDTSNVTNMSEMFLNCTSLINVPSLNTSNVTSMEGMFRGSTAIYYLDLSEWDFSKVVTFCDKNNASIGMFSSCSNLRTLILPDVFCTSNITNLRYMFSDCESLQSLDLTHFNTSNVTDMSCMFKFCSGLTELDLSSFNTSKVTNMSNMFRDSLNLTSLDLSSFNTSNVTNMSYMFNQLTRITSIDLSSFDTSKVTNISNMFGSCRNLTKVEGYISVQSLSQSTMSNSYLFGYSNNTTLRKITFKDIGYHSNATQFNTTYATNWGVDSDTVTDGRQSLIDSLITYSYDRATAGYSAFTISLASNTKAVLSEDEIAQITAKGYTIA